MDQSTDYKKEKVTINLLWANLPGVFIIILIILLFGFPYYFFWREDFTISGMEKLVENTSAGFIAAIGDFMIIYLLRKEDMHNLVEDHPSEAGCYIYRKIN